MPRIGLAVVLTLSLILAPLAGEAQEAAKVWRIGFVSPYSADFDATWRAGFRKGLRDLGYVEGKNIVIEERHFGGALGKVPRLGGGTGPSQDRCPRSAWWQSLYDRCRQESQQHDPHRLCRQSRPGWPGLVVSLARPGGQVTGISDLHGDLIGKRLELLKEAVPSITRIAVLHNANPTSRRGLSDTQAAASVLGLTVFAIEIRTGPEPADIDRAFTMIRRERAEALNVSFGSAGVHTRHVADLAVKSRLLTIGTTRIATESGYLMSYGADFPDLYRRAAIYVDKILKGAKPADLPVEQPTKFELVVNLKTAKALGLTIPQTILLRADHVIQ
jgi:putative tryptophan/tyrosine transport system substrate-binding protein